MSIQVRSDGRRAVARTRESLVLDENRFFDAEPTVRRVARELYEEVRDLPLICPHGHVDPRLLADDAAFPEPTTLLIVPDHYIFRMLYSQGIAMEELNVPRVAGGSASADPRKVWQLFGEHYHLFRGTPTGAWLNHELYHVFGVRTKMTGESAQSIYDEIQEKLGSPEFRPRALFEQFRIEVLTTTDAASDSLEQHRRIRDSGWSGRVIPCFRPDAVFRLSLPEWREELAALERASGVEIGDYAGFVSALEERRAFFRRMGASSTDHAVFEPLAQLLPGEEADALFQKARRGEATLADQRRFEAHMLMEMARMSAEDGLVMQLHPGSFRNHNERVFRRFGLDKGADIPIRAEYTRNLHELLNAYGNDPRLTLVLFTLDESTYARELAPLAGHYPAVKLGPPWWFHDSIEGMIRFRQQTTETAGIYNTVGFNDDTRAFCSIPARHDLARRVDCNWLAGLVARHVVDMEDAREMAFALSYSLAKDAYRLGTRGAATVAPPAVVAAQRADRPGRARSA
jgi:glucuronate isomerase